MGIDLASFDERAQAATRFFWETRLRAARKQRGTGKANAGERAAVTAGKNMDGFVDLVRAVVVANGLPESAIHTKKKVVTLPGFFRPTKEWDVLVVHEGLLVAALEFK